MVPYNPYLLRRYRTHINVEVCASVQAVKYIHKYIYKGSDRTSVRLGNFADEINQYLQGRYIGPSEAIYRLFEYPMHEEYPPVIRLSVHLPGQQAVYFHENASPDELHRRMEMTQTILMAFFEYNKLHLDGRSLLYQEFPTHYTYHMGDRRWHHRKRGTAIGRIYHCNPFMGERYYLRLLLTVVRGLCSFEDLRTVDGIIYPSFQLACQALGLLEDDKEWVRCFKEASVFSTGHALRALFVMALLYGDLTNAAAFWLQFANKICDNLPYQLRYRTDFPIDLQSPHLDWGLFLFQQKLSDMGKSLKDFHLPLPQFQWESHNTNPLL